MPTVFLALQGDNSEQNTQNPYPHGGKSALMWDGHGWVHRGAGTGRAEGWAAPSLERMPTPDEDPLLGSLVCGLTVYTKEKWLLLLHPSKEKGCYNEILPCLQVVFHFI